MNIAVRFSKRFIPLIVLFGLSIFFVFLFSFLAKRSDVARTKFYKAQKELELYRTGIWHLEKLNPDELNHQLERMEGRFPSTENLAVLIEELTHVANNYNLSISSITPSEKVEAREENNTVLESLSRVPVEIRLDGNYEDLGSFLSQLSTLEHGVIRVEHFRMEKVQNDPTRLSLSLEASLYVKKSSDQNILVEPISSNVPLERQAGRSRFNAIDRNPFTRALVASVPTAEAQINLEGIIYDPAEPLVLINGETKRIGDLVHHMKIIDIQPDSVLFEKGSEQVRMRLRRN